MSVSNIKVLVAENVAALNTKIAQAIADGQQPIGAPFMVGDSLIYGQYAQMVGENENTFTEYKVLSASSAAQLASMTNAEGAMNVVTVVAIAGNSSPNRVYLVGVGVGSEWAGGVVSAGGGGSVTLPAVGTAAEIQAGTVTESRLWSPKVIHDEIARQIAAIPPAGGA